MSAAPYFKTPKENDLEEEILSKKEYKGIYYSDYINILIGKTKKNIILRSDYYELKLNIENLSILTKTLFKTIDESFEFIINIFNQKKFSIKVKNSNLIIINMIIYDMIKGKDKKIELCLKENFDNKNYLIKELYNKYNKLEKEIIEEKKNKKIINEENNKLKQENMNMKMEIESIKNNHNNKIGEMKINILNMSNQIYQLQQQINQFIFQINQIYQQINSISMNNNNIMNQSNGSFMNQNSFNLMNQNNSNLMSFNEINPMNQYCDKKDSFHEIEKSKNCIFRFTDNYLNYEKDAAILISFHNNDLLSELIQRFISQTNIKINNKNLKYIFNAKQINTFLTAKEVGLMENCNIFVVGYIKITFTISGLDVPIIIIMNSSEFDTKVSELIDIYLDYSGLNIYDIIRFEYNSKILNVDNSRVFEVLENNSTIFVITKKKFKTIFVFIKYYNNVSKEYEMPFKMECLKNTKIKALIEIYKNKFEIKYYYDELFYAFFNSEKIDVDKRIEETKIKNNSTIIISKEDLSI